MYIRAISKKIHRSPAFAAKRAADHGVSFVAIMGAWQQPRKDGVVRVGSPNAKVLNAYVDAFNARGIRVGLWFYPWAGHEEALLEKLRQQCESAPIDFLINDAELGYKWKSKRALQKAATMRGVQPEAIPGVGPVGSKAYMQKHAAILAKGINELVDQHDMAWGHWFTSYGIAGFHPNLPWDEFSEGVSVASPQLYTATPKMIDRGIREWYKHLPDAWLIPSIGTYGEKSNANMHEHLSCFVDGDEGTDGFIAWSWRQTNASEWDTLKRWAAWVDKGVCFDIGSTLCIGRS